MLTLKELFDRAIEAGIVCDLRGEKMARAALKKNKKKFEELKDEEKEYFDSDCLTNPFSDSRILHGPETTEVNRIMVGIDIGEGELILADRLREKGQALDAVVSHHPGAHGLAGLAGVMTIQPGIYATAGIPLGQAEAAMAERIKEVQSRLQPINHQRAADAARLLDLPYICVHTPADNAVAAYLTDLFEEEEPETLGDVMELLHQIPEYQIARREQTGPVMVAGDKESAAGKIMVEMTGGTEGAKEMYAKLARAGISTVVGMHLSKEHIDAAKAEHLNVILAGHISSDNLGMNLILDQTLDGAIEVVEIGGFRRVER